MASHPSWSTASASRTVPRGDRVGPRSRPSWKGRLTRAGLFRFQTTRKAKGADLTSRTAISGDGRSQGPEHGARHASIMAYLAPWRPRSRSVAVVMLPICVIAAIALKRDGRRLAAIWRPTCCHRHSGSH